jgi:hypothetical protein
LLRGGRAVPKSGIGALTSKRGPRNFYKGKGCKSTGRHTSKGAYVLMEEKLPKYVVPDLTNCKVRGLQSLVGRIFVQVSLFVACVWISIVFWVANVHKN